MPHHSFASLALVTSLVKGEDTGSDAVLSAHYVDELSEQVRAEDEVGAFNGWLERLVVAVVDKVASPTQTACSSYTGLATSSGV